MSQCEAVVVELAGKEVWVEVPGRAPACGSCKTPETCQDSLLGMNMAPRRYRVGNSVDARVGDRVSLVIADGMLWRAALVSYVMPLGLAIGGAVIGHFIAGDMASVAGCLAGLAAGIALLRLDEVRARREENLFSLQVLTHEVRFKEQP